MKLILIFAIACLTFYSCGNRSAKQKKWENKVENTLKEHLDKTFYYPTDAPYFEHVKTEDSDTIPKHRIFAYIDGTCSQCVKELDFWEKFSDDLRSISPDDKSLNIFIFSPDPADFDKETISKLKFKLNWKADTARFIPVRNNIWDKRFQVLLVDQKDRIKVIGNPVLNPELRNYYLEYIKNN
ncbi:MULTISPECIES: hypothetical protein [Sphingobacterium]|uniref:hypothetical protein n=1 Tax=Sphingobacterium TaxID=28453 RepID=UPI001610FB28|nr:hypothetical protein [Sphingobacterium sp. JUb56]MBB2950157.1 hypothetical protein [Sphingobacterium sp. JUb56]